MQFRPAHLIRLVLLLIGISPALGQTDDSRLEAGRSVEREMRPSETHPYAIDLENGQYVRVIIDQYGIDVALELFSEDGAKLLEVDSPNGRQGREVLRYIPHRRGTYRLLVRSLEPG